MRSGGQFITLREVRRRRVWHALETPTGPLRLGTGPTYIRRPPFLEALAPEPEPPRTSGRGASACRRLGHHRPHLPAGSIQGDSPAGRYLSGARVEPRTSILRRTARHHESDAAAPSQTSVAENRSRRRAEQRSPKRLTYHLPRRAAPRLRRRDCATQQEGVPLIVIGGKDTAPAPSRDWRQGLAPARIPRLLAESFERIHRSNLVAWASCRSSSRTVERRSSAERKRDILDRRLRPSGSPPASYRRPRRSRDERAVEVRADRPLHEEATSSAPADPPTWFVGGLGLRLIGGPCWTGPSQASPVAPRM